MQLLHRSEFYRSHYDAKARLVHIDFGQKVVRISFCQFLALHNKLNQLSMASFFDDDTNPHGFTILTLCNNEHLFVLNTFEVLDLKSLVHNSFAAFGLSQKVVPVSL